MSGTGRRLTDDEISLMRAMRRDGLEVGAIADSVGCSVDTVYLQTKGHRPLRAGANDEGAVSSIDHRDEMYRESGRAELAWLRLLDGQRFDGKRDMPFKRAA